MRDSLVNWTKMRQIGQHCLIFEFCTRLVPLESDNDAVARLVSDLPVYSIDGDVSVASSDFSIFG